MKHPKKTIKADYIFSGGRFIKNAVMETRNGKIEKVRQVNGEDPVTENITDYTGKTVIPALIDAHAHLFMSPEDDPELRGKQLDAEFDFLKPIMDKHMSLFRENGVAAFRDGGDRRGHCFAYKKRFQNDHPVTIMSPGLAFNKPGRYGKLIGNPVPEGISLKDAFIKRLTGSEKPDHIKIVQSGINSLKIFGKQTPPQFEREELAQGVDWAHDKGYHIMVHANGEKPVKIAVEAGCDSVEHGFFMGRDNLKRMADAGVYWVPTAVTMKAYAAFADNNDVVKKNLDHQLEQIAFAVKCGVRMAVGTDAGSLGVCHGKAVFEEMQLMIQAGMPVADAVRSAGQISATLTGLCNMGDLLPGYAESYIVFNGSPEDLVSLPANIHHIYLNGEKIK